MGANISDTRAQYMSNDFDIQMFYDLRQSLESIRRTKYLNLKDARRLFICIAQMLSKIRNSRATKVELPSTLAGTRIAKHLRSRFLLMKTESAVCVVDLRTEGSWDVNIAGRGYHALRNNISRSNLLGHTCHQVDHKEFACCIQIAILNRVPITHLDLLASEKVHEGMEHWVGKDKDGRIIALCRLVIAERVAHVKYICVTQEIENSVIRWSMNYTVIKNVYERGVDIIIYDAVLKNTTGNIYFLKRLGAQVKKLAPVVRT